MFHIPKCSIRKKIHFQMKVNHRKRYSKPRMRKDKQRLALTFSSSRNTLSLLLDAYNFHRRKPHRAGFYVCGFCQQSLSQLGCFTGMEIPIASPRNSKSMGLERAQVSGTLTWNVNNGLRDRNPTLFLIGFHSNRKRLV